MAYAARGFEASRAMPHNVLHILGTGQPEGTGVARIVSALARGLDADRYRVHAGFLDGEGPLLNAVEAAGARSHGVRWIGGARDVAGAWRFWRHARSRRFDIVHAHVGGRALLWLARAATQGKIVLHVHGSYDESRGVRAMDVSGRWTDEVIAVSRDVAERVRGREARVIHSGVEIPGANGSGLVPPGSASGLVLGTAGRLAKVKGLGRLLRAVAQLRHDLADVRLEIAGSGPERGSLEAEVRELGLAEHVRFLGWCPDLQPIFAGWDVVVQPSLDEGLPMATLEAMAAGLPVVATAVGGFMEIVEDGKTGWLVPPHDPVALVDRLRSLLLDGQQRHAMGAAGRTRIREHFSVRAMVAQISDVYDRLMQE